MAMNISLINNIWKINMENIPLYQKEYIDRIGVNGFKERTLQEIRESVLQDLEQLVPNLIDLPNTLIDNLISTGCLLIKQNESLIRLLFNGISDLSVIDPFFDLVAQDYNLSRHPSAKSTCDIEVVGLPGYIIPEQTQFTTADGKVIFYNTKQEIITSLGTVTFTAMSNNTNEELKDITVNGINKLQIPNENINTVRNITAPSPVRDLESLNAFRKRIQSRLRTPIQGSLEGLVSVLSSVKGVDPKQINVVKSEQQISGVKYNSIEAIVGGGDQVDVAKVLLDYCGLSPALLVSNPSSNETSRTIIQNIQSNGSVIPVKFTRPKTVKLTLTVKPTFNDVIATNDQIKLSTQDTIIEGFNKLTIKDKINKTFIQQLFIDAMKSRGYTDSDIRTVDMEIKLDNVVAAFNDQGFIRNQFKDSYIVLSEYIVIIQS